MKKNYWIVSSFILFSILPAAGFAASDAPARQAVQQYIDLIQKVDFSQPNAAIEAQADKANQFLDFEALCKKSMPSDWDKASTQERADFLALIQPLVSYIAYPKSQRLMKDQKVEYPNVTASGTGYSVTSVVKGQEQGLDVNVIYHLYPAGTAWRIDDVTVDDVSITEDLRYQFEKIIKDSGFQGLLQKMRERLDKAKQNPSQN